MEDLDGSIVQKTLEAWLRDTSMVGSNGAKDDVVTGTNAQDNGVIEI